jgi:acetyl esterase
MPLDEQAEAFLRQLDEAGGPPLNEMTPAEAREALAATVEETAGDPEPVGSITNRTIPGPLGDIPIRVYAPEGAGLFPALVYFHGGGWVAGDLEMVDPLCTKLTSRAGAVVVSVDYRLAPEHKFPAPLTDCYSATQWVSDNAAELNVDPRRIAVGGDSSGGNLAAAVSVVARNSGTPDLAFQLLFYPVTNLDYETNSYRANGTGYFLTTDMMRWFWDHYLESEDIGRDIRASPLLVEDASGLPPTFVVTAEFDPLRDEGEAYAELLREAGNDVTVKRYDGQIHGFVTRSGIMDKGKQAIEDAATQMRQALGAKSS